MIAKKVQRIHRPAEAVPLPAAFLHWNPGAHDPETALARALRFVAGESHREAASAWAAAKAI